MVTAALFDWDGTLSDSRQVLLDAWHASTQRMLGRRYPDSAAEEDVVFTLPGSEIWPAISQGPEQARRLAEAFQADYARTSQALRTFPGIPEMLRGLRDRGVAVAVVTSKGRRRLGPDAERIGLTDLIDVAVCAGEAAAAKPDPAAPLAALEQLGVAPAEAAMVGDTVVDIAAGSGAGTLAIGVSWGHGTADQLRAAGADAVADTPAQLLNLLLGRPAPATEGAR
jgi:HAD superfamily hydrolase (TIGR01509 family)